MVIKIYENNDNITNFYIDNYNWPLHTNIQYLQISKSVLTHVQNHTWADIKSSCHKIKH